MKKLFVILTAAMMAVSGMAQEHLKFCGIEISGTSDTFAQKLVKQGFKYDSKLNLSQGESMTFLRGTYAGYQNCTIALMVKNNVINIISVEFPVCRNWASLNTQYKDVQRIITSLYGTPADVVEDWYNATPTNDKEKWSYILANEAYISTQYIFQGGEIDIVLGPNTENEKLCNVTIYFHVSE